MAPPPPPPPPLGDLKVVIATTGSGIPSNYTLDVSGVAHQSVGSNTSTTFSALPPGQYTVTLTAIPSNCAAAGSNTQTIVVPPGGLAVSQFALTCDLTGSLTVRTSTTGTYVPNGYNVHIDAGADQSIGANGSISFPKLSVGDHQLSLVGIPADCSPADSYVKTVTITLAATDTVIVSVTCQRTTAVQGPTAGWTDPDGADDGENSVVISSGFTQANDNAALWNDVGDPTPGANLRPLADRYNLQFYLFLDASAAIPGQDIPDVAGSVTANCSTDAGVTWTQCGMWTRLYQGFAVDTFRIATDFSQASMVVPPQLRVRLVLSEQVSGMRGGRTVSATLSVSSGLPAPNGWPQYAYPITW